jgi:hypothetical protein
MLFLILLNLFTAMLARFEIKKEILANQEAIIELLQNQNVK